MKKTVKRLIERKDTAGLQALLTSHPSLANEGITIPYDLFCRSKAHPLHRLCDAVFAGKMTDDEAIDLAKVFLDNGANIDGNKPHDTPLLAAASLHAEALGIFYIENGADINFTDPKGKASALHWAAYCGLDKLVNKLLQSGAIPDEKEAAHHCTPLAWAIHCLSTGDNGNRNNQVSCMKLLLQAGAEIKTLREDHMNHLLMLADGDSELEKLVQNQER